MKISGWGRSIRSYLTKSDISEEDWNDLSDILLLADLGSYWTTQIINSLRQAASNKAELLTQLESQLVAALAQNPNRELNLDQSPAVIILVGVNGVGKTTSAAKIAANLKSHGRSVLLGAADTFRAAAVDQLKTWGARCEIEVISKDAGADPASVAHETVTYAKQHNFDVVILDTAGRLHNKTALMDELQKVVKVANRVSPVTEILLVLDATVGQNGLAQAKIFAEAVLPTGIVLTKFDGTAKGGIVIAIEHELGIPVKFIGIGEGISDLKPFDPQWFVAQMLETNL